MLVGDAWFPLSNNRAVSRDSASPNNIVRVTDAKEVGVGNPAEETFCHPDAQINAKGSSPVKRSRVALEFEGTADALNLFPRMSQSVLC